MINLDNISFIEDSHGKRAVIISIESYERIKDSLEELEDIKSYIDAKSSEEEVLPFDLVEKLIIGDESKIKLMRQHRGLSTGELAKSVGITEAYLSQLENHKRKGTVEIYKKLSKVLNIDIDLLV